MTEAPIWQPSQERIQNARITHYHNWLQTQGHQPGNTWQSLHQWSIDNPAAFWETIWQYFDVRGQYQARRIFENGDQMPGATWFGGARLNFAENLLRGEPDRVALIEQRENGRGRQMTYGELREHSARLAGTLQEHGVSKGDRVAAFITNGIEAIIGMLATARLGAVWSSCSPDFGFQGVLERFGQIEPRALIAVNGYQYNGKAIDTRERVEQLAGALPSLSVQIRIDNQPDCPWDEAANTVGWKDALMAEPAAGFTPMAFDDPLYILYSSGTTGAPKCIVHGIGGTLLQHLKELGLHTDVGPDDVVFYYTTTGWMMWNWLASTLALGATAVLYDGSPMAPTPEVLWNLAEEHGITVFGASAKYYAACGKQGLKPAETHGLDPLKAILSTGSPLAHESFDYIYRDVKPDVCLSSISGGTDIVSCFALGNPTLPVYRGELQCLGLGMDVAIYNHEGQPVAGQKGELVCRAPFPCMPVGFWNDPEGERFHSAYFNRFPNTWAHGDFGEIREHPATEDTPAQRGMIIHGRADAVLNPGGVRIGTAEIYRQVEKLDDVLESIAVGQQWGDDQRVVLFVRLREDVALNDELCERLRHVIRENTTPRHVPAKIIQVPDIPRTLSGKIVELAVRNVIHGESVKNREALANPNALDHFRNLAQLRD
ncbi:acetoacetate--CoA ligase [uncultured Halovibrio sp.]|uniref:acetoacetate--CoA ligase n=1 Tax=uncultured Halovibrio sp. TaxID=985049 RepID=UPI0025E7978F|nr:acetoacetate--CoA ligase [uncultured Halovibrio sp.]